MPERSAGCGQLANMHTYPQQELVRHTGDANWPSRDRYTGTSSSEVSIRHSGEGCEHLPRWGGSFRNDGPWGRPASRDRSEAMAGPPARAVSVSHDQEGGGRQGRVNRVGRRGALYRTAVAGGGGGRRTGGGAARAGPCVTNRSGLIYWGWGIGGWLSAVQRETVMTEGRGLLGRAAGKWPGRQQRAKRRV